MACGGLARIADQRLAPRARHPRASSREKRQREDVAAGVFRVREVAVLPAQPPVEREEMDRRDNARRCRCPAACSCAITSARLIVSCSSGSTTWNMCQLLSRRNRRPAGRSPSARPPASRAARSRAGRVRGALGVELVEMRQLAQPDPRGDVGQVEFSADQLDLHAVVARCAPRPAAGIARRASPRARRSAPGSRPRSYVTFLFG